MEMLSVLNPAEQQRSKDLDSIKVDHKFFQFLAPTGAQGEAMLSVRACVCPSVRPFPQIMSSSKQASKQAGRQAGR